MLYIDNLGECEYSFFMGCKHCEECKVVERRKAQEREYQREQAREQAELEAWFEEMEVKYNQ